MKTPKLNILKGTIADLDQFLSELDIMQIFEEIEDCRIKERKAFDHLNKAHDLLTEVLNEYEKN